MAYLYLQCTQAVAMFLSSCCSLHGSLQRRFSRPINGLIVQARIFLYAGIFAFMRVC